MVLLPGTRLGTYEILAPLGAGGMGEVYRARDSKLVREVAIKVLPTEVSADRNRLVRFEQEARSASALNHPNIVTIYEIGSVDSVSYIAMELVQGKTLRELLTDGPLPAKRLLALSAQVADGLARAHEAGIVHRDLKPDNVMVTREGLVKILDFGLAKPAGISGPEMSQLPTIAVPTEPGVVLGTVGYMSPEQAMGRPVDFRSDQFSLGSILYEMATGKRAFSRGSAPETLAAIIREEPEPVSGLAPQLPLHGERRPLPWAHTRFTESSPRFSPDGRWIAYQSDESGDPEIYVALTQGGGGKRRISPAGGQNPRWRGDGKELYYVAPGDLVTAVRMTPGAQVVAGEPVPLFRVAQRIEQMGGVSTYDVAADGSRFLIGIPVDLDRESQVNVVVKLACCVEEVEVTLVSGMTRVRFFPW